MRKYEIEPQRRMTHSRKLTKTGRKLEDPQTLELKEGKRKRPSMLLGNLLTVSLKMSRSQMMSLYLH